MNIKEVLLHLRLPFSLFLLPVYIFAVSQQIEPDWYLNLIIFIVLHLFIYPASNAYNSFYDKDEGSIGGLENPPPVDDKLLLTANLFDFTGILLGLLISKWFALACILYSAISRLYSHPAIRLKKYPFFSWLLVGFFQGAFIYILVYYFGQRGISEFDEKTILPALISSLILYAVYPITQVYQHDGDRKNGDITMSIKLGIKGTFLFATALFILNIVVCYFYLELKFFMIYNLFCLPITFFMIWWFIQVWKDEHNADFRNTMRLNIIASISLNLCFLTFLLLK